MARVTNQGRWPLPTPLRASPLEPGEVYVTDNEALDVLDVQRGLAALVASGDVTVERDTLPPVDLGAPEESPARFAEQPAPVDEGAAEVSPARFADDSIPPVVAEDPAPVADAGPLPETPAETATNEDA